MRIRAFAFQPPACDSQNEHCWAVMEAMCGPFRMFELPNSFATVSARFALRPGREEIGFTLRWQAHEVHLGK